MIAIKAGVRVRGISNEILLALIIAESVFKDSESAMTITSLTDGKHSANSLHYTGDAVDLRLPANPTLMVDVLRTSLGLSYDVVLESDHIHIEYDPK